MSVDVVPVHVRDDVPAVGSEALGHVVGVPVGDVTLLRVDRDAVVVVEGDQFAQAQRARERPGFMRDTLHHAAVAHEHVRVVVHEAQPWAVVLRGEELLRERHADRVGKALPERPGGGLDAGYAAALGVPGGLRAELAEALQLHHRQLISSEMEQAVKQHGPVAVGQHEPVAVGPVGICRVVAQVPLPERHRDLRHAHRHARVAGFRGFHRVHGERAKRIGELGLGSLGRHGGIHRKRQIILTAIESK